MEECETRTFFSNTCHLSQPVFNHWYLFPLPKTGVLVLVLVFYLLLHKILEKSLAFRHLQTKSLLVTERLVHSISSSFLKFFPLPTSGFHWNRMIFISIFIWFSDNGHYMFSILITAILWFTTVTFANLKMIPAFIFFISFSV